MIFSIFPISMTNFQNVDTQDVLKHVEREREREREEVRPFPVQLTAIQSKNEEIGKSAWKSIDGNWLVRSR